MADTTGKTPPALLNRPVLKPHLAHLLEAFYELSSQRMIGEVPQPIQISEILAYVDLLGVIEPEDRQQLLKAIRTLDAAYLEQIRESMAAKK